MPTGPRPSTHQILYIEPETADTTGASRYLEDAYDNISIKSTRRFEHTDIDTQFNKVDCIVVEVPSTDSNESIPLSDLPSNEIPVIVFTEKPQLTPSLSTITDIATTIVPYTGEKPFNRLGNTIQQTITSQSITSEHPWALLKTIVDAVITLDIDGRVTHVYSQEPTIFDVDPATLKNENFWEVLPSLRDSPVHDAYTDATSKKETHRIEAKFDPTETWYRYHIHPTQESTTLLIEDITDRKDHETTLKNVKTHLQTAIEAGAIGTWLWNIQEDELIADPHLAKTFGIDSENARNGLPIDVFTESIHDDDYDRVIQSINDAVQHCDEYEAEYRVHDADGDLRWVVARGHVECDDTGTPQTFPGILTDITERKRYEHRLEEQNERLEEFASVVSHDLRNPLQVVEGHLELIQNDIPQEHYDTITRALNRMDDMITGVLSIARTDNPETATEPLEVNQLIHRCWENFDQSSATLTGTIDHVIEADEVRLRQIFENLFRNAIDHSTGDVTITVGELDDGFFIADNGPGIPEEHHDSVLDIGYSTDPEGTGFGLIIVEQAVIDHDWTLTITDSQSGGARFEITDVSIVN